LENFAKRLLILRDERAAIAEITLSAITHSVRPTLRSWRAGSISEQVHPTANQGIANLKSVARSAMGEAESIAISEALTRTRWHRKRAAELLDISYKALLYKIKQYDLERPMSQGAD
jgi:DNA-binding NtrC family response regulator